jgi:hypothetical protein
MHAKRRMDMADWGSNTRKKLWLRGKKKESFRNCGGAAADFQGLRTENTENYARAWEQLSTPARHHLLICIQIPIMGLNFLNQDGDYQIPNPNE